MPKSILTLEQLLARLHEHDLELAALRADVEVQFKRIASMQAELDVLPHARKRRQELRDLLALPSFPRGNNHARD